MIVWLFVLERGRSIKNSRVEPVRFVGRLLDCLIAELELEKDGKESKKRCKVEDQGVGQEQQL